MINVDVIGIEEMLLNKTICNEGTNLTGSWDNVADWVNPGSDPDIFNTGR